MHGDAPVSVSLEFLKRKGLKVDVFDKRDLGRNDRFCCQPSGMAALG